MYMPICCEFTNENLCLCTNANTFESSVIYATYISVRKCTYMPICCEFISCLSLKLGYEFDLDLLKAKTYTSI